MFPLTAVDTRRRVLTDPDIHALETSFDLIAPRGNELMDEFYSRLFERAPAVRPLFANTDLQRQKAMLLGTLVLLRKSGFRPQLCEIQR